MCRKWIRGLMVLLIVSLGADMLMAQAPFGKKRQASEDLRERRREIERPPRSPQIAPPPRAPVAAKKDPRLPNTPGTSYKFFHQFEAADDAQAFLTLAYRKQMADGDVDVLERLQREKMVEFRKLNQQLKQEFEMEPERDYEFDPKSKEIRLVPLEEDKPPSVHSTLSEAPREELFLRLFTAKRLTSSAHATLELLVLEKQREAQLVDAKLLEHYGVKVEEDYYYDSPNRQLYLIVKTPTKEELEASIEIIDESRPKPPLLLLPEADVELP